MGNPVKGEGRREKGEIPHEALRQAWDVPTRPRPIVVIGAGAIVRTAHLPAYRRLRLPVAGIFDLRLDTAGRVAAQFGIPTVHRTLTDACQAGDEVVFDVAGPGDRCSACCAACRKARRC